MVVGARNYEIWVALGGSPHLPAAREGSKSEKRKERERERSDWNRASAGANTCPAPADTPKMTTTFG
jgi:hypothetical protein